MHYASGEVKGFSVLTTRFETSEASRNFSVCVLLFLTSRFGDSFYLFDRKDFAIDDRFVQLDCAVL